MPVAEVIAGVMVEIVSGGPTWLVVETRVPDLSPDETLRWFTEAARLNQWWGDEALIEPRPGGLFEVGWPSMGWIMRGVVALCTADTLVYSWTWDHEPGQPARTVVVHGEPAGNGTILTVTHGPYRPSSPTLPGEDEDRASHRDGWLHFLPQLHEAIAGEDRALQRTPQRPA